MKTKLQPGDKAPDFTAAVVGGSYGEAESISLSGLLGKTVILYFYPKDDTPGCTTQACEVRDMHDEILAKGAVIFGVSVDLPFSADAFSKKNELNFPILSDMNREVTKAYDVLFPNLANVPGLDVSARAVYLIDADGIIQYVEVTENPGLEPNYDAVMAVAASL